MVQKRMASPISCWPRSMKIQAEEQELTDVAGAQGHRIGRRAQQQRPDEPALPHDRLDVALVVVGVAVGEPADLFGACRALVLAIVGEVAAIGRERGPALIGHDLQAEPGQVEVAHDLGPQQAADVGAVRVGPARLQLAAERRPADPCRLLEHERAQAAPWPDSTRSSDRCVQPRPQWHRTVCSSRDLPVDPTRLAQCNTVRNFFERSVKFRR